jgi:hypothetical protein
MREYIDEFTPMPSASVRRAMIEKPGDFRSERSAKRRAEDIVGGETPPPVDRDPYDHRWNRADGKRRKCEYQRMVGNPGRRLKATPR